LRGIDGVDQTDVPIDMILLQAMEMAVLQVGPMTQDQAQPLTRSQGSGHGRKPDNQEQNATGRPRQPTMLP
jgi:hypothetical protein